MTEVSHTWKSEEITAPAPAGDADTEEATALGKLAMGGKSVSFGKISVARCHQNVTEHDTEHEIVESEAPEPSWRQMVRSKMDEYYSSILGKDYSSREATFVLLVGGLMAFNCGFINGSCVSGLLTGGTGQSVAGYTASYTKSGLAMAQGDWESMSFPSGLILSYFAGSFIAGILTPDAKSYQIEPTYGPTFLIGGVLMAIASILADLEVYPNKVFCLVAAANGVQNGIASIYSANLIRVSMTGATCDLALTVAQLVRGNLKSFGKGLVLALVVFNFWLGGIVSFYATRRLLSRTLFINAALFWAIGIALVFFLVREIGVSVQAAVFGTWQWKKALQHLQEMNLLKNDGGGFVMDPSRHAATTLSKLFDAVDLDGDGEINSTELTLALNESAMTITDSVIQLLIQSADTNKDGKINREEWCSMIEKIRTLKQSSRV